MAKSEYEITHSIIRYAIRCSQEGDWHTLRDMGFSRRECDAIANLTLTDLAALERRMNGHVLKVELNRGLFWAALADMKRESSRYNTLIELISRDAPADMMRSLFGMQEKTYTRLRRELKVSTGVGRPQELDPDAIWRMSEAFNRVDPPLSADDWISMADKFGLPLRAMWREYRRWEAPLPQGTSIERDTDRP